MFFKRKKKQGLASLLNRAFMALVVFPPIYIVARYLRWCSKQEEQHDMEEP